MASVQLKTYRLSRRKPKARIDFGAFFAFFGVSGVDHGREQRTQRRFEEEYFANVVTLMLSGAIENGLYHFAGLPERVNRRGWRVQGQQATTELSDDGLEEFREWLGRGVRQLEAVRVGQS